jgi:AcrR family transcriptional regulator
MSPLSSCRDKIVDAAEKVVIKIGAAHMTLDAVAEKASVSKGGLLYHFSSKETLLKAMLERRMQRFKEAQEKKCAEFENGPTREIKAHILSTLGRDRKTDRIGASILAAIAYNPKLLDPARKDYRRRLDKLIPAELRFERAAVIVLAVEGLRLLELLSLSPFNERQRKKVTEELLKLADEEI